MSKRSTQHATFAIERSYEASPPRVFKAWSEQAAKARWFGPAEEHELDFRVGGSERLRARSDDDVYTFAASYEDIVPDERIVYSYQMHRNDTRISVSVATVELLAAEAGTLLRFTEQGVFLDGHDTSELREHGTTELLDGLDKALREGAAA
jgi:uncharacterized protein YndB with AHSA1/START domain